ncbi:MAG TPA: rhomboid family intramembrane serine protease [Blastocatellia bacterium]|nr:rhomboid family intramembrane serine protease [Blastocatellia bacterium]
MNDQAPENITTRHFRVCPHCGQMTPALLPECASCGARSLHSAADVTRARGEEHFISAFLRRATPVTYAIFGFNVVIFLLMNFASVYPLKLQLIFGADPETLKAFGAKTNDLITKGDYFRLVTPIFIHIGLLHLLTNSYALWIVGPQVEKLYGSARFALLYLGSGIGGALGSYLNPLSSRTSTVPGAGASGALFGLFGVLAVFGFKYRAELPEVFRRAFGAGVLPVILLNLLIGYSIQFIDNAAHIGGLLTGAVLAWLIPYIKPGEERVTRAGLILLALCVTIVSFSFTRAWQQSGKYLPRRARSPHTAMLYSNFNSILSGGLSCQSDGSEYSARA